MGDKSTRNAVAWSIGRGFSVCLFFPPFFFTGQMTSFTLEAMLRKI